MDELMHNFYISVITQMPIASEDTQESYGQLEHNFNHYIENIQETAF